MKHICFEKGKCRKKSTTYVTLMIPYGIQESVVCYQVVHQQFKPCNEIDTVFIYTKYLTTNGVKKKIIYVVNMTTMWIFNRICFLQYNYKVFSSKSFIRSEITQILARVN